MGLMSGSVSISRFNVPVPVAEPDFEAVAFREIAPGSEVRERSGFVPMEPGAPYEVGTSRFAFRVRMDKLRPDTTAVQERVKALVQEEEQATGFNIGPKRRKKLREMAEEELIVAAVPRSRIIECCLDGKVLYVGSTAKQHLGTVMQLLRKIGIVVEFKTPWLDREEPDLQSELVETYEPGESVLGCRFLRALLADREMMIEPESGFVRLMTRDARVTLMGAVRKELHRYAEQGAEVLAAKILTAETSYRLDGLTFRLSGLKVESGRHEHWTALLDERLEKIIAVFEQLDQKYASLAPQLRR